MFHPRTRPESGPIVAATALMNLRDFVTVNFSALQAAAELLAGRRGGNVLNIILDGLQNANSVDRRTWKALRDLLGILTLEHVHDDTRIEAMLFAEIDPADPIVEEICLLTDGLRSVFEPLVSDRVEIREYLLSAA